MQHKAISQEKWVNLCVCIDVERQLLLHPQWRHSSMGIFFFFVCFVLPVATTVVQRTPTGEKFPAATRSEHGCSTWAFAHTQLVWVEGLISWPHCSLCQTRDGAVLPSTSAWGLAPVTGTGAAGAAPGVAMLFYSTRQMEKIETHKIIVLWIYNNILLIYYATKIFW